jgi:uncharacterized membrane protein
MEVDHIMGLDTGAATDFEEKPRVISSKVSSISLRVALTAIMTALVTIVTSYLPIPIPITGGIFNLGEGIIYTTAILFGPYLGGFAGGVGAATADMLLGYSEFAPITLVVKMFEGFVVGYAFRYLKKHTGSNMRNKIVAILLGIPVMVAGYWLGEFFILDMGPAAYGEVPFNLIQCGVGLIIALLLIAALEKITFLQDQDVFS